MKFDVIVIGAGAAGLMAATEAGLRGRSVLLLEKKQKPGLKILISGGGRCNLTTTKSGASLEREYGARRGRWLRHALRSFQPRALRDLIEGLGVPLQEEDLEKIFPVSARAGDILDALLRRAESAGVMLRCDAAVVSLEQRDDAFRIALDGEWLDAESVVVAVGGLSYPRTGSTGDGYAWARHFGHTVTETHPHLAPLRVDEAWVHDLAGITLPARVRVRSTQGEWVERMRPLLFTHLGLSGPAPMDLAGAIEEHGNGADVHINFAPDERLETIEESLIAGAREHGRRPAHQLLPGHVPDRLRRALAQRAEADVSAATLGKAARRRLAEALVDCVVPVPASLGYRAAEVTRGGVELQEVDARTMESRLCPGLYFCGEVLDVDGPIGGFNFQAAFATGRLAGQHA